MSRFNADAEMSVVGGVLIDNTALDRVANIVTSADFAVESCRLIFEAASRLIMRGYPADPITVMQELDEHNELERAGGLVYIGNLYRETPSAANVARYAEVVRDLSRERAMLSAIRKANDVILQEGATSEKITAAADLILGAADQNRKAAQITYAADLSRLLLASLLERGEHGTEEGLDIGFVDLQRMTGPLKPGQLVVIAGRPAMGKSTLARNIAEYVAQSIGVLFVSLEMDADEIAECMTASLGRASFEAIKVGNVENENALAISRGATVLSNLKITVATGANTTGAIHSAARTEARRLGSLGLIVVDYLQLLEVPGEKDRRVAVDAISRNLKRLAMTLRVPVIALSQLSRKVEDRNDRRPLLSDLRESGAIEQDADKVVLLYRDEYYYPDSPYKGIAEAIVAKNRRGKTGMTPLTFIGDQARFADVAPGFLFDERGEPPVRRIRGFQ